MQDVIRELEEQLRFADGQDDKYAEQLRSAIQVLKEYDEWHKERNEEGL